MTWTFVTILLDATATPIPKAITDPSLAMASTLKTEGETSLKSALGLNWAVDSCDPLAGGMD
jgi:hypothetical protein